MVESRAYSLAVGWVSGSNGYPLDAARAAAFWRTANIDVYSNMDKGPLQEDVGTVLFGESREGISPRNSKRSAASNPECHGKPIDPARQSSIVGFDSMSAGSADEDQAEDQTPTAYSGAPPDYASLASSPEPAHFPSARAPPPPPQRRASDVIGSSEERSVSPEPAAEEQAANGAFIEGTEPMTMEEAALAGGHLRGWTARNGLQFGTPTTTAAHRVISTDHPVPLG